MATTTHPIPLESLTAAPLGLRSSAVLVPPPPCSTRRASTPTALTRMPTPMMMQMGCTRVRLALTTPSRCTAQQVAPALPPVQALRRPPLRRQAAGSHAAVESAATHSSHQHSSVPTASSASSAAGVMHASAQELLWWFERLLWHTLFEPSEVLPA